MPTLSFFNDFCLFCLCKKVFPCKENKTLKIPKNENWNEVHGEKNIDSNCIPNK